jgi:hypothetical protein
MSAGPRRGLLVVEAPRSGGHVAPTSASHVEKVARSISRLKECKVYHRLEGCPDDSLATDARGAGRVGILPLGISPGVQICGQHH